MAGEPVGGSDAPRPGEAPANSEPLGIDAARFPLRDVGFCVGCDRFVERGTDGSCAKGHPARMVAGRMLLEESEAMPTLPRFNVAAFLIPPIWGLFYGQWVGVFFIPLWIFASNAIVAARNVGGPWIVGALGIAAATLAFQFVFAWRGNGLAWRSVCRRQSIEQFRIRQRYWAAASVAVWVLALAFLALRARG